MDRGRPTHVLLTFDAYKKMSGSRSKFADLLAMPGTERLDIDVPQLRVPAQPAKLYRYLLLRKKVDGLRAGALAAGATGNSGHRLG